MRPFWHALLYFLHQVLLFSWLVGFFSQIALSAHSADELEPAPLLLCSCAAGPKHPPPSKATKCLDQGGLGQGEQIQQFRLSHVELRASGGALGGLDLGGHGKCDHPPSPFSACGARGSSVCPRFPRCFPPTSFSPHTLPAHCKPSLVSRTLQRLSWPA